MRIAGVIQPYPIPPRHHHPNYFAAWFQNSRAIDANTDALNLEIPDQMHAKLAVARLIG
jgi:hypothetical protein